MMKIYLKQLFGIVGESKDISFSIGTDKLSAVRGYRFASPVAVSGRIYNRAGIVYLTCRAEFLLSIVCDRCLKESERSYGYDIRHVIVQSLNSDTDDDEYIVAGEDEVLDLGDTVLSDVLLRLPTRMLCREDCKGLCMKCGCDLNESDCGHAAELLELWGGRSDTPVKKLSFPPET